MHKFLALCLFSLILIGNVSTAVSGILFYDNCEDEPDKSEWQFQITGNGNSFSVSSEQFRAGSNSYKYILNPGNSTRVEHALIKKGLSAFEFNKVYWIGYSFYLPNGSPYERGVYGQLHGRPDTPINECDEYRNPLFVITPDPTTGGMKISQKAQIDRCSYSPDGRYYDRSTWHQIPNKLLVGEWNDIVMQFKLSYTTGAFFIFFLNGALVLDDNEINCYNDQLCPYFKFGIYGSLSQTMTAFYDEFRVGDSNSFYDEISPKRNISSLNAPLLEVVK